ncbi:hypothetical protein B0H13DRAFT_2110214, partial [Mycena leptocephala]
MHLLLTLSLLVVYTFSAAIYLFLYCGETTANASPQERPARHCPLSKRTFRLPAADSVAQSLYAAHDGHLSTP